MRRPYIKWSLALASDLADGVDDADDHELRALAASPHLQLQRVWRGMAQRAGGGAWGACAAARHDPAFKMLQVFLLCLAVREVAAAACLAKSERMLIKSDDTQSNFGGASSPLKSSESTVNSMNKVAEVSEVWVDCVHL